MAAKIFYVDVDYNNNEIKNVAVHRGTAFPANPVPGQLFYRTDLKKFFYYNSVDWIPGTNLSAQNKQADAASNYGVFDSASGDVLIFRNIKAKSGKILVTLSAGGEIEIDANISKLDVGLGNVTNDSQVKRSEMGVANGVATLDGTGKVPAAQLPAYVDDVVEFEKFISTLTGLTVGKLYFNTATSKFVLATSATAGTSSDPETGKIYVDMQYNKTYRWSGTQLTVISETLALGESADTAYDGARGKTAYDHSQIPGGTGVHISDTERTNWNNKAENNQTLTDAYLASDTAPTLNTAYTIKGLFVFAFNAIKALLDRFNVSTGHSHNGTDSKKVDFSYLTGTSAIVKKYVTAGLTGTTGSITAATHGCGTRPQVQFLVGGSIAGVAIDIGATGTVTWSSNKSFVAGDTAEIIIQGA